MSGVTPTDGERPRNRLTHSYLTKQKDDGKETNNIRNYTINDM